LAGWVDDGEDVPVWQLLGLGHGRGNYLLGLLKRDRWTVKRRWRRR
jgi:hypothetical protein